MPGLVSITAISGTAAGAGNVTILVPVVSITVAPANPVIVVGGAVQLVATLFDVSGNVLTDRPMTWTGSSTSIATVSSTGLVTGTAIGPVTVTVAAGSRTGFAQVTVAATPPSTAPTLVVTPPSGSVTVGGTLKLVAADALGNVLGDNQVTWTSNPASIVTVSPSGLVSGVSPGRGDHHRADGHVERHRDHHRQGAAAAHLNDESRVPAICSAAP